MTANKEARFEKIRYEEKQKKLAGVTFKPKTNKNSAKMDSERGMASGNRGLDLYNTVQNGQYKNIKPVERDL